MKLHNIVGISILASGIVSVPTALYIDLHKPTLERPEDNKELMLDHFHYKKAPAGWCILTSADGKFTCKEDDGWIDMHVFDSAQEALDYAGDQWAYLRMPDVVHPTPDSIREEERRLHREFHDLPELCQPIYYNPHPNSP